MKLLALLKLFVRLLLGILFLWFVPLMRLCRKVPGILRGDSKRPCGTIPPSIYKRPDPMIYDQYYLRGLGYGVTWDNPDIQLYKNGAWVQPHELQPDTEYEIRARIWNGSSEAPAIGMPVKFSFLSFGIGTVSHHIGQQIINLPVKGAPGHPASASQIWKTPAAPGHYCIQVELIWADDANPDNNLGQKNTDVKSFNSPTAKFSFALRNSAPIRSEIRLEADEYVLQDKPLCSQQENHPTGNLTREEKLARRRQALKSNGLSLFSVRDGWSVDISPKTSVLEPDEEIVVSVIVTAPSEEKAIDKVFNVNAYSGSSLIGGVSLRSKK